MVLALRIQTIFHSRYYYQLIEKTVEKTFNGVLAGVRRFHSFSVLDMGFDEVCRIPSFRDCTLLLFGILLVRVRCHAGLQSSSCDSEAKAS